MNVVNVFVCSRSWATPTKLNLNLTALSGIRDLPVSAQSFPLFVQEQLQLPNTTINLNSGTFPPHNFPQFLYRKQFKWWIFKGNTPAVTAPSPSKRLSTSTSMVVLKGTGISIACGILGPDWKGNAQFQLQILTREKQNHEATWGTSWHSL